MMRYEDVVISLVNINGLIHKNEIDKIYKSVFADLSVDSINLNYLNESFIDYENNFFIHDSVHSLKDRKDLLDDKNLYPYYNPTSTEIKFYLDEDYIEKNNEYNELFSILNKYTQDEEISEDIIFDFSLGVRISLDFEDVLSLLERSGVEIPEEQFDSLLKCFVSYGGTIRSWKTNGFTLNELKNRNTKTQKVGRNEPCPCGSGKKYKKCCIDKEDIGMDDAIFYENIFEVSVDDKNILERKLMHKMTNVHFHIMNMKEPSLEDLISDVSRFGAEYISDKRPQDIVGSLLYILFRRHNVNITEKRKEQLLKVLRVYGKRDYLDRISYYIERECLGDYMKIDSIDSISVVNELYRRNNIEVFKAIPKKNPFKFLETIFDEIEYSEEMADGFEKFALEILKDGSVNQKLELYKLVYLFPFLPFVLYEFLQGEISYKERLLLLKSIIKSYEIRYENEMNNKEFEFTVDGDNKIYILSIDSLAFFMKEEGKHKKSLELYDKALSLDPSNKYGYSEANLINYIKLGRIDIFDKELEELEEGSLYKIFLDLLNKLIKDEPFHNDYLKAYDRCETLLEAICENDFFLIDEYDHTAKLFAQDFLAFFNQDRSVIKKLKDIHQNN